MSGKLFLVIIVASAGLAFVRPFFFSVSPQEPCMASSEADPHLFTTGAACISCHSNLVTPSGEDISIGTDWRASMMANSARDPYWQAAVRRETMDHPEAEARIEDECASCHMPMSRFEAKASDKQGQVFAHLPVGQKTHRTDDLAADGVSCTVCHQITAENLGARESFTAGFVIDTETPLEQRAIFGPYDVDAGRSTVMHSASGFRQVESRHIQQSELCATCHTLFTEAIGPTGEIAGELPEQVPYLEWRHSAYREERSCQSCHMPVVQDTTAISSVLGEERTGVSRHVFQGGNFFMLRMLNRYRAELGVEALPNELEATARQTEHHLQLNTARISIENAERAQDALHVEVRLENLAGHKLPTGYPSRRSWIHFTVHDRNGAPIFESGGIRSTGQIPGNDNDNDSARYEPHYQEITKSDQVQIYESVMVDIQDQVTTGLLRGVRYIKDNRLLPRGFDKASASEDIAVHGRAKEDADFVGGSDAVRYIVDVSGQQGPFAVQASLWYQPIGYRWAHNLKDYDAPETNRFVEFYDSMSEISGIPLATAEIVVADP